MTYLDQVSWNPSVTSVMSDNFWKCPTGLSDNERRKCEMSDKEAQLRQTKYPASFKKFSWSLFGWWFHIRIAATSLSGPRELSYNIVKYPYLYSLKLWLPWTSAWCGLSSHSIYLQFLFLWNASKYDFFFSSEWAYIHITINHVAERPCIC